EPCRGEVYQEPTSVKIAEFKIPEQSLENALLAFARQAGVQLVMNSSQVGGFTSSRVTGRYSRTRGLQILIGSLPFSTEWVGTNTLVIKRRRVAVQQQSLAVRKVAAVAAGP